MTGESGNRVHFEHVRLGRAFVDHPVNAGDHAAAQRAMGLDAEALHALKGLVMRETRGKASPTLVDEILQEMMR